MTIFDLINNLRKIAEAQPNINSTGEGNIYDFYNANPSIKYSTFFITQDVHKETEYDDIFNITLFYVDRLMNDNSNKLQIQSAGKSALSNIIRIFADTFDAETEDINYQPFTERFADSCAGIYARLSIRIQKETTCPDTFDFKPVVTVNNQSKTVEITENGKTIVSPDKGYDGLEKVEINTNVPIPALEENKAVRATENGKVIISPDEGFDGLKRAEITVDVPKPVLNSLHTSIDKNGQYLHKPSENEDGWDTVVVNVNVPSKEAVTEPLKVIKNGTYTPSVGIDGYNKVEVNIPEKVLGSLHPIVNKNGRYEWTPSKPTDGWYYVELNVDVPMPKIEENKVIQITSNGKTTVSPSYGFDGLKKAEIEVNVPSSGGTCNLGTLTATENKVYRPVDLDGWDIVEVKVPEKKIQSSKTKEITQNGVQMVQTDYGYDGMKQVVLDVNVPSKEPVLKEISIIGNGSYTPPSGVDGYNKITVNVPQGGSSNLQEKEVTVNGTVVPDKGFDGLSKVIVNVPQTGVGGNLDITGTGWETEKTFPVSISRISNLGTDLDYTRTKYSSWKPETTSGFRLYYEDLELIYAPKINTNHITDMGGMFDGCENLYAVPALDTSNATNMDSMFSYCLSLSYIPKLNISKVTSMRATFQRCETIETIPLLDTGNVKSMFGMFIGCSSLVSIPKLNTSNVTDMSYMFQFCKSLTTVPKLDTGKVTGAASMFNFCTNLENLGGLADLKTGLTLKECTKLTKESLLNVLNNLGIVKYDILTLGSVNLAKLTEADIAIGTNKGWQIVA